MKQTRKRLLCIGLDLGGGGAERVQTIFLRQIDRSRFQIRAVFLRKTGPYLSDLPDDIPVDFIVDGPAQMKNPWVLLKILWKLPLYISQADLVFIMLEGAPAYLGIPLSRLLKKPVIFSLHTQWTQMLGKMARWHRAVSRWVYPEANIILTVSEGSKHDLCRFIPRACSKIRVLRNPVNLDDIRNKATEPIPIWAEKWFERPVLLAVGRLSEEKGFDLLIPAFDRAIKEGLDWNLLILGEGKERVSLETQIASLELSDRVVLPGFVANPYSFMHRSSLFVLSSRYEGLPMVILEAVVLGIPIVSVDCTSGLREILGVDYPFLVESGSVGALSEALIKAMRMVEKGSFELKNKYAEIARRYDSRLVVEEITNLLDQSLVEAGK